MGKNENWHLLPSQCRLFYKTFTEMFLEWSSTKHIFFVITSLIWLVTMATNRQNLWKNIQKPNSFGMKLKLCSIVSNISLYKIIVFYLLLLMHFGCYGNLKFPLTYNRKSENWARCGNFDKGYRNVPWVVLFQTYKFCPKCWTWLVAMALNWNLRKNIKK